MHILMLQSRRGSEDGYALRFYQQGHCYRAGDRLGRTFIRLGWAMECHLSAPHAPCSCSPI
jgi:hypothetical protein